MAKTYQTKEEVYQEALKILNKSLRVIMPAEDEEEIGRKLYAYGTNRKGFFGELVEKYVFGLENNNRSEADFNIAGVELKTTPVKKHEKKRYVSKERLVFSMIDYKKIVDEEWDGSSFLKKNSILLLMFYLYDINKSLLDYEFKLIHLLDLLGDIPQQDMVQIRKDWEFIADKVRRGEAHLLSEGDTYYLGACTKASNGRAVREQPRSPISAKPRAFSFKQQYLNYLIQRMLGNEADASSMLPKDPVLESIDEIINEKFSRFIGKIDKEIAATLGWHAESKAKNYKQLLANRMLGVESKKVEELEKAEVTMKVVTLEHTGTLKESLSFPAFDYKEIVDEVWYDEERERIADFYAQLDSKRFLFVIFQKIKGSDEIVLRGIKFWNFPVADLSEAERVWEKAVECIREGRYSDLPKMSESPVAHVRPHAKNGKDTLETPQGTQEVKRCFWLNAKYIQKVLET